MKTIRVCTAILIGLFSVTQGLSQDQQTIREEMNKDIIKKETSMNTYVIEREIPNAGNLSEAELQGISQKSNEVLADMGPGIEWLHSYVTDNKVYCVYKAENEALIRTHAEQGGFPVNSISLLATEINPETANKRSGN